MLLRHELVNAVIQIIGAKSFLQVGSARFFDETVCPVKKSVHFESIDDVPAGRLFDVVFVDPPHDPGRALFALNVGQEHLSPTGVLLVANVNPAEEWMQEVPASAGVQLGQGWMAWVELRHTVGRRTCTVDADHGIGVVLPVPATPEQIHPTDWRSFSVFAAHREHLLGLVQEGTLEGIVRGALSPEPVPEVVQPEPVQPTPRRRRRDR